MLGSIHSRGYGHVSVACSGSRTPCSPFGWSSPRSRSALGCSRKIMAASLLDNPAHRAGQNDLGLGHASEAMQELGSRPRPGGNIESLGRLPATLATWAKSRKRTPDAIEEQTFAKAALALIQVALVLGYDRTGPPSAQSSAAAASPLPVAVPMSQLHGHPAAVARRRAAAAMPLAVRMHNSGGAVGVAARLSCRVWKFAPWVVSLLLILVAVVCLRHPDVVFMLPVACMGWVSTYMQYAVGRLLARIDGEVHRFLFGTPPSAHTMAPEQGLVPPNYVYQQPQASGHLGWISTALVYAYYNHN